MLFHEPVFLIFFLIVFPVYLLIRKNNTAMNWWFMIASYVFYGYWYWPYIVLLFGTSAIDYLMVVLMERKQNTRKLWLVISLVSNFGLLAYFKYSTFITENINWILAKAHLAFQLPGPEAYPNWVISHAGGPAKYFAAVVLSIGISFHTFQSMSYTIDAY